MALEVVGQERSDGALNHPFGEDLTELLREKGGGDELGSLGVDGHRLDLRVNAPGEVPPDNGVLALKFFEGEIAGAAEPSARVLAEVDTPQLLRAGGAVEEEPSLAAPAGDPQAGPRGGLMEDVPLGAWRCGGRGCGLP